MGKKQTLILVLIIVIAAIVGVIYLAFYQGGSSPDADESKLSDIILFYGRECPHCQALEKSLAEQKITEKIKFDQVEVYHSRKNAGIMNKKAQSCGINNEDLGVPFLFAKGQCYIGNPDIEAFFQKELTAVASE
ncbi:MAG: hypothetical protein NTZ97_00905 [Candidatus Moranbacteria bacterium]|nr:hypothetical protein [Candidatus Moranbacteria bacterium]